MRALKKLPPPLHATSASKSGTRRVKPPPMEIEVDLFSMHPSIAPDMDLTADWFPQAKVAQAPPVIAVERSIDDDLALLQRDARRRTYRRLFFAVVLVCLGGGLAHHLSTTQPAEAAKLSVTAP